MKYFHEYAPVVDIGNEIHVTVSRALTNLVFKKIFWYIHYISFDQVLIKKDL